MSRRLNHWSVINDRYIRFARITKDIKTWAANIGVKIVRVKEGQLVSHKIGIHLLEAEQFELENALERAEKDQFKTIYLHTFSTWHARVITKNQRQARLKRELKLIQGGI